MSDKNPYLVNVRDLLNRPGEMRERELDFANPEKLGEGLAWVPEGRAIEIDFRLESVHEGILVSGEARTTADAQSARTLRDFDLPIEVDFQELFAYPSEVPSDYEVQGDHVDLEPVVRDAVVLALPFQPEFPGESDEVELPEGITLVVADDEAEAPLDQRWAALAQLREDTDVSKEER
ncbi:DUF177 domain-containing protein [Herbiconiux sp. L3-i23]|uniref:YceD family protein n=1 Tax=Herbiconiux sp. L3-i23 TaxID=2905871 RepID=UPI00205945EE|nr:DUF177 domain-containing protein [Herbiconiux sp. L3-i23]BDI21859.1 hypothetical protein L3i23_06350 [Herbiconiux sp. L3-i23]